MKAQWNYELTSADLQTKMERYLRRSSVGRIFPWFAYFAIIGLAWTSTVLFFLHQGIENSRYLWSGGFALVLTLTLPSLYRWYQATFWRSIFTPSASKGLIGRRVLTLSEDFLEEEGTKQTVRIPWREVCGIEQDSSGVWIIVAPMIALMIPVRAFAGPEEREEFIAECERRAYSTQPRH